MDFETETFVTHALRADGFDASEDGTGRGTPLVPVGFQTQGSNVSVSDIAGTLRGNSGNASGSAPMIAFDSKASGRNGFGVGEVSPTLRAMGHTKSHSNAGGQVAVNSAMGVRRLTPRECERLQGFPDDYTLLTTWKGWRPMDASETPESCRALGLEVRQSRKTGKWRVRDVDGPRYKALGNSWAVPVVRWIGQRIELVDAVMKKQVAA